MVNQEGETNDQFGYIKTHGKKYVKLIDFGLMNEIYDVDISDQADSKQGVRGTYYFMS